MNQSGFSVVKALVSAVVALAVLAIAGLLYIEISWDRPTSTPARELGAPQTAESVARGEYLYNDAMLCWTCHGSRGGHVASEPQSGGKPFDLSTIGPGFGKVWASNLTADVETGIGGASDGELVRAIREGIDQHGKVIFPVMAYQFYHDLGDTDALALVAYMRTFPPVTNAVPPRQLSFIARALIALRQIAPEPPVVETLKAPANGVTIEYGRYLTWHAAGCAECHTPRFPNNGQVDRARPLAGGLFALPEEGFTTTASNLTPDEATGLGRWSEADFIHAMRIGERPDGTVMLPFMPWPSYARWSDEDLRAVWAYLRSVAPVAHRVPPTAFTGAAVAGAGAVRGEALFDVYCIACHGQRGRGGPLTLIPLAGAAGLLDDDALRAVITDGPSGSRMPGFGKTLEAEQLSDVIAFIRSWQR